MNRLAGHPCLLYLLFCLQCPLTLRSQLLLFGCGHLPLDVLLQGGIRTVAKIVEALPLHGACGCGAVGVGMLKLIVFGLQDIWSNPRLP